jgi:cell division protein FtsL
MNAAARLAHQNILSRYLISTHLLNSQQLIVTTLVLTVLLSALSIIYMTHATRLMHAAYAHNIAEQEHLHLQEGQLLLERSTWMVQARIQQIAEKKLEMVIPDNKSMVIVRE